MTHTAYPVYKASPEVGSHLQQLLVDLIDLSLQGKQAHWNIVGPNFRDLHLQLDEVVDAARGFTDQIAERMRAIYVVPDGRAATVAENTSLAQFPSGEVNTSEAVTLITTSLYAVASTGRKIHDDVDEEDPTSADLIHAVLERLEQLAWMIDAENRTAGESKPASIVE